MFLSDLCIIPFALLSSDFFSKIFEVSLVVHCFCDLHVAQVCQGRPGVQITGIHLCCVQTVNQLSCDRLTVFSNRKKRNYFMSDLHLLLLVHFTYIYYIMNNKSDSCLYLWIEYFFHNNIRRKVIFSINISKHSVNQAKYFFQLDLGKVKKRVITFYFGQLKTTITL